MNVIDMKMTVYGGGNYIDAPINWLQSWGATARNETDCWREVFNLKGFTWDNRVDPKKLWLQAQTGSFSNDMHTMEKYALENGLYTFAPVVALWDSQRGITVTGSGVSSWIDQVGG